MNSFRSLFIGTAALFSAVSFASGENTLALMPSSTAQIRYERITTGVTLVSSQQTAHGLALNYNIAKAHQSFYSLFPAAVNGANYDGHILEIQNLSAEPADFDFGVYSLANLGENERVVSQRMRIPGNQRRKFAYYWLPQVAGQGLKIWPPLLDEAVVISGIPNSGFQPGTIKGYRIYNLKDNAQICIKDLRLFNKRPNFNGIVDGFGQWSDIDWLDKVTAPSQLATRAADEAVALNNSPIRARTAGYTEWGKARATGVWRVEQAPSGNWNLVTPQGGRFWSIATQTLFSGAATVVENRGNLFTSLPARDGEFGKFYSRKPYSPTGQWLECYDFFSQNLYYKYGNDYVNKFRQVTNNRLDKWGFNTVIGLMDAEYQSSGRPYTKYVLTNNYTKRFATPFTYWFQPVDVFEPDFALFVNAEVRRVLGTELTAPSGNCIGVTIDNELSWGFVSPYPTQSHMAWSIPVGALNQPMTKPVKAAMITWLKTRYRSSIGSLNIAWGTSYPSWATLEATNSIGSPTSLSAGQHRDFRELLRMYADQYYKVCRSAVKTTGFKGLYMGSRDNPDATPDVVWQSAAKLCDVVTVNLYAVREDQWTAIGKIGRPVMISEFAYNSTDRGHHFPNLDISVVTQEERADRTEAYFRRAATMKNVVGAAMWCYTETMPSGRWADDERINSGIIDITDTPFIPLVQAVKRVSDVIPSLRKI